MRQRTSLKALHTSIRLSKLNLATNNNLIMSSIPLPAVVIADSDDASSEGTTIDYQGEYPLVVVAKESKESKESEEKKQATPTPAEVKSHGRRRGKPKPIATNHLSTSSARVIRKSTASLATASREAAERKKRVEDVTSYLRGRLDRDHLGQRVFELVSIAFEYGSLTTKRNLFKDKFPPSASEVLDGYTALMPRCHHAVERMLFVAPRCNH